MAQVPDAAPEVAPDLAGPKDALLVPGSGAGLAEPSRLPQIAQGADPALAATALPEVAAPAADDVAPEAVTEVAPRVLQPQGETLPPVKPLTDKPLTDKPLTDPLPKVRKPVAPKPDPELPGSDVPGVVAPALPGTRADRLPQVGAPALPGAMAADAQPVTDDRPIARFARDFSPPSDKPLFVILLQDVGGAGMRREDLAGLPFPVTFVVDPLATDAREAETAYRAAGQEVLMLANGIPPGATAGDVAQTFQTLQDILPETVGVIDEATLGFQDNRALSGLVLPVIADQGRGLVTYDRGLNAADQIARRDGLPAAVIFRRLDGEGESQSTMRRYLDRAAFKAAQEGVVVVIGDTRAETVAALLQWTLDGRAATVNLAPVTAALARK